MKKIKVFAMVCLACTLFVGCKNNSTFNAEKSGIFVKKDGTITEVIIEEVDNEIFNLEEFRTFAENEISAFNMKEIGQLFAYNKDLKETDNNATLPIALNEIMVKDNQVSIILDYLDYNYYSGSDFNRLRDDIAEIVVGKKNDISEAGKLEEIHSSGIIFKDNNGNVVTDLAKLIDDKMYIVNISGQDIIEADSEETRYVRTSLVPVTVDGEILYVSSGISITGKNEAQCIVEQEDKFDGTKTYGEYIIFK
jgi:hypothetical protein